MNSALVASSVPGYAGHSPTTKLSGRSGDRSVLKTYVMGFTPQNMFHLNYNGLPIIVDLTPEPAIHRGRVTKAESLG